ncbi:UPF0415 protein C7orf25 homolog [Striga asiatica]|uniref:UPF0415 protein C7orf25 homolog n=1 Tax=Striga asiatica TaxID=4170 RepID=A0A5A7Q0R8_STRAF|nr:UPF0415 protein C7orf25 homolog [Striga asiatica]
MSSEKMDERESAAASVVEDAKRRCATLTDRLHRLNTSKLSRPLKNTISRLIQSELNFLHRVPAASHSLSHNIGHLEAVVHVLQQPSVTGVSRVCKAVSLSHSRSIYVDIVCSLNGNPVWFIVSDRNPRYIFWDCDSRDKNKGLKQKIVHVLDAARQSSVTLRPSSIVLFFSRGLDSDVDQKLRCEFGAVDFEMENFSCEELQVEGGWTYVVLGRLFPDARFVEIEVHEDDDTRETILDSARMVDPVSCKKKHDECFDSNSIGSSLCHFVSAMKCWCCSSSDVDDDDNNVGLQVGSIKQSRKCSEAKVVNFDTTVLVAIVSGISNGGSGKLLAKPESELRARFKGNYDFVIAQVDCEHQHPIHNELLSSISGKQGIICESVRSEFEELISMCGGPNEKLRAEYLLKFLKVVPDCPSTRLISLQTTRKLAVKNKVVFGTGDNWCAQTVTANMGFVRAVSQTGMSLSVIEHRPRALIGE